MTEQEKSRLAELEVAQARAGQSKAELERDLVASAAVNAAVHRVTENAAVHRVTENAVTDANMRANQAESQARMMATSASIARGEAASERASASNATFTATLGAIFVVGLIVVIGGYFLWYVPNQTVIVTSPQKPNNVTINTPASSQAAQPAPNITINNRTNNPAPAKPTSKAEPTSKPDPTDTPNPTDTPDKADPADTSNPADTSGKPTEVPKGDSGGQ